MASNTPIPDLPKWTFLGGDGRLARRVGKPVRRFLHVEASGGVVLLLAAIAALIWANSPWSDSYYNFGIPTLNLSSEATTWGESHII